MICFGKFCPMHLRRLLAVSTAMSVANVAQAALSDHQQSTLHIPSANVLSAASYVVPPLLSSSFASRGDILGTMTHKQHARGRYSPEGKVFPKLPHRDAGKQRHAETEALISQENMLAEDLKSATAKRDERLDQYYSVRGELESEVCEKVRTADEAHVKKVAKMRRELNKLKDVPNRDEEMIKKVADEIGMVQRTHRAEKEDMRVKDEERIQKEEERLYQSEIQTLDVQILEIDSKLEQVRGLINANDLNAPAGKVAPEAPKGLYEQMKEKLFNLFSKLAHPYSRAEDAELEKLLIAIKEKEEMKEVADARFKQQQEKAFADMDQRVLDVCKRFDAEAKRLAYEVKALHPTAHTPEVAQEVADKLQALERTYDGIEQSIRQEVYQQVRVLKVLQQALDSKISIDVDNMIKFRDARMCDPDSPIPAAVYDQPVSYVTGLTAYDQAQPRTTVEAYENSIAGMTMEDFDEMMAARIPIENYEPTIIGRAQAGYDRIMAGRLPPEEPLDQLEAGKAPAAVAEQPVPTATSPTVPDQPEPEMVPTGTTLVVDQPAVEAIPTVPNQPEMPHKEGVVEKSGYAGRMAQGILPLVASLLLASRIIPESSSSEDERHSVLDSEHQLRPSALDSPPLVNPSRETLPAPLLPGPSTTIPELSPQPRNPESLLARDAPLLSPESVRTGTPKHATPAALPNVPLTPGAPRQTNNAEDLALQEDIPLLSPTHVEENVKEVATSAAPLSASEIEELLLRGEEFRSLGVTTHRRSYEMQQLHDNVAFLRQEIRDYDNEVERIGDEITAKKIKKENPSTKECKRRVAAIDEISAKRRASAALMAVLLQKMDEINKPCGEIDDTPLRHYLDQTSRIAAPNNPDTQALPLKPV